MDTFRQGPQKSTLNYSSEVCKAGEVLHGSTFPKEVIEGSAVTVTCDKGFVVEGEWQQICQNGTFNNGFHSLCVKIDIGIE